MNRRNAIKGVVAFSFVGASVFSIKKWFDVYKPVQISQFIDHKTLIAELAETIIPRTSSPGAKDAKVEEYIITMLINCTEKRVQHTFIDGLKKVQTMCMEKFNKTFETCDGPQKILILKVFEHKAIFENGFLRKIENKLWGQSFFSELKQLTVRGYFTSRVGATECLAYDYVPGKYQPCIPLTANQKSWATK